MAKSWTPWGCGSLTFILYTNCDGPLIMVTVKNKALWHRQEITVPKYGNKSRNDVSYFQKNIKYKKYIFSLLTVFLSTSGWKPVIISRVPFLLPRIISVGKHILLNLIVQLQESNCSPYRSQESKLLNKNKTKQVRTDPGAGKVLD